MIILPSMGRPHLMERFTEAYWKTKATLPVVVVLDEGDIARRWYGGLRYPEQFTVKVAPAGMRIGPLLNAMVSENPDETFYGFMADDCVPETECWDVALAEACQPDKVAWGYDGLQNEGLATHPFVGGDLVRKLGWLQLPGAQHCFGDTVLTDIAKALGKAVYRPEVRTVHHHILNGKAPSDATYANQPDFYKDREVYEKFKREEFGDLIARLRG